MTAQSEDLIRIFVGTDRSQRIGLHVLEYSIGKHTDRPFEVLSLESVVSPEPNDKRNTQRTGFSFSRFAIPSLCNYQGKAIYMDADMLVFKDIGALWDTPFGRCKVLIQGDVPNQSGRNTRAPSIFKSHRFWRRPAKRAKQSSVSLLNCEELDWDLDKIVAGLDGQYNYKQLMSDLCILKNEELGYSVPMEWNSLEHFDANTCNLHYTDMQTQPWVCPTNPLGYLWLDTVREMLATGALAWSELEQEVAEGFARPSLLTELSDTSFATKQSLSLEQQAILLQEDAQAEFEMHKSAKAVKGARDEREREYMELMPRQGLFDRFGDLRNRVSRRNLKRQTQVVSGARTRSFTSSQPLKILFVANSPNLPTLQLAFTQPLRNLVSKGVVQIDLLTEWKINANSRIRLTKSYSRKSFIKSTLDQAQPDLLIFCRYTGVNAEFILDQAKLRDIRVVSCLDDDLLDVPPEIGAEKYAYYADKERQSRIRYLLANADLVYASTEPLADRLRSYGVVQNIFTPDIFCSAETKNSHENCVPHRFGYMGFGHEHDIQLALPGIISVLQTLPSAEFELFGTIPKPTELEQFGSRVSMLEPDWDYQRFMAKLAERRWAVGICPLAPLPFNDFKVSTKWLEYSAAGAAVVASDHSVYRRVIKEGNGLLVADDDSWGESLYRALVDREFRAGLVINAQQQIKIEYSDEIYEKQFDSFLSRLAIKLNQCDKSQEESAIE